MLNQISENRSIQSSFTYMVPESGSSNDTIKFYLSCGIISIEEMMGLDKESLMKKILKKIHPYAITALSNGRYQTYVNDASKPQGRRQIRKPTEADLYAYLLQFYEEKLKNSSKSQMSFKDLYLEWIEYKKQFITAANKKRGLSQSTIRRYERDYDKCIANSSFEEMPISSITAVILENFIIEIIKKHKLLEKSASNLIGYITQAFAYARRAQYINNNPSDLIDRQLLLSTCPYVPPKDDSERILTASEFIKLIQAVRIHEAEYPDYIPDYAIELAMLTGMRVGELAALKWSSIDDDYIHVVLSEHRIDYKDKPSELVIGEPKNGKHRLIPLTADIRELLDRIKDLHIYSTGGFVFAYRNGDRCTGHNIGCAVSRRASEAGIDKSSIHEIRRTVSSLLREVLPATTVANLLGHLETTNSRFYNYDTTEYLEKKDALEKISTRIIQFHQSRVS